MDEHHDQPDLRLVVESVRWPGFYRALESSGLTITRMARDVPEPNYVTVEASR